MTRRAVIAVAIAAAVASTWIPAAIAAATLPPDDDGNTDFLRRQGDAAAMEFFVTVDPSVTSVACTAPADDVAGVQFLCYGINADGTVQTAWASLNDDGGIDVVPAAGATAPTVATTSAPRPTVATYEGTGSQTVQVDPITGPTIIAVRHDGTGTFSVQPQQGGVPAGAPLFAEVTGAWSGRYLVGLGGTISAFAVTADGDWTLRVQQRSSAIAFEPAAGVAGDRPEVVNYGEDVAGTVAVTYDGSGPIVIRAVTVSGPQDLVNEAGPFSGDVTLPAGPGFITVDASGAWSITPPAGATPTAAEANPTAAETVTTEAAAPSAAPAPPPATSTP
jgi:hypothetical protein